MSKATEASPKQPDLAKLREPFDPLDLEWKIQTCGLSNQGKPWALIVPYIQSRALMSRLDDVVGPENWRAEYLPSPLGKGFECRLSVRANGEWVEKRDAAEESDIEAVKGAYTNAFKRVCVVWGMGRELYEMDTVFADVSLERRDGWKWASTPRKDRSGKQIESKSFYWAVPEKMLSGGHPEEDDEPEPEATTPRGKLAKVEPEHAGNYKLDDAELAEARDWLDMPDCEWVVDATKKPPLTMAGLLRSMIKGGASSKKLVQRVLNQCRDHWADKAEEPVAVTITADDIPFN